MLPEVVACLACPHCREPLASDGPGVLRCAGGRHVFDVARQGYVSLLPGDARTGTADTAAMVAARADFLAAGHYAAVAEELARSAGEAYPGAGCVADLGAGTGYYLAAVLDALPQPVPGLALDLSKFALRRAARAHPRAGAVVCDAWRPLPVRDGAAGLVLNVFAPRRGEEIRRVLRPGGSLLVVSPAPGHLAELVGALGLLAVDERKEERLHTALGPYLEHAGTRELDVGMALDHAAVETVVLMGPSAWHTDPEALRARIAALPDPVRVGTSVRISRWLRR